MSIIYNNLIFLVSSEHDNRKYFAMRFGIGYGNWRYGKHNEGHSIQAPIDNLNRIRRDFWDSLTNHLNTDVKSYFKLDPTNPNGYGLHNGLHKIRIWM